MGFCDSVIAGNLLGEEALAGVNLLSPLMAGVTFFAGLIGVGMGVNAAFELGRCDTRRSHAYFTQGLWLVLTIGSVLTLLMLLGREAYLAFMNPSVEIANFARAYWRWFVPMGILEPIVIWLVNAAMTDGDGRLCFTSYFVQLFVNVGVSFAGVKLGYGLGACAFGTLVGNLAALGVLSWHFYRPTNSFRLIRHFSLKDSFRILGSSFGDASSFLCASGLFFLLNKFVSQYYGSAVLPVLGAVISTIGFLEIFNGIGVALSPVITVYAGEGNMKAIRTVMRQANHWIAIEGLLLSGILALYPGLVVAMVGIDDPASVAAALKAVRIVSIGFVFYSAVYVYNSYYIFIEHEVLAIVATILNGFVMPMALVFALGRLDVCCIWFALATAPVLAVAVLALYIVRRYGWRMFPLLLPPGREELIRMFDLTLNEREISSVSRQVGECLLAAGVSELKAMRASLMTEEVLMTVRDRNQPRSVLAEVTVDLNSLLETTQFTLTFRDDGEIFDITDADQSVSSLRTFLVASVMEHHRGRKNIITAGFNRNVFKF